MQKALLGLISIYKAYLSPSLPKACRFYPSCSDYMSQSIKEKGLLKGLAKGVLRILRCHPFNKGGYDPV